MCGIAGFLNVSNDLISHKDGSELLQKIGNTLRLRGPDSLGWWFDERMQFGMAHRRLSIVDLSDAGEQPMHSQAGRFVLVYNGEIYNHLELRKELSVTIDRVEWSGSSDTEVFLACIENWGIEESLEKIEGMFAFALWDKEHQVLTLGRDRFGEKPLYFGWQGKSFIFGSQLKALRVHPDFEGVINRDGLSLLLRHSYIPAPYSIYKDIQKLEAGHLYTLDLNTGEGSTSYYWSSESVAQRLENTQKDCQEQDVVDTLEQLLKKSVGQQMLADVPLGAFLSGGIDSSTIAALMQNNSETSIKTFSIGFHESEFNEATYAKEVAEHLGTDHTELYVSAEQAQAIIPKIADVYDEPFSDSSQIPTYLVSKLAGDHVTVVLSGDGADELFCGYNRYTFTNRMWRNLSLLPISIRRLLSVMIQSVSIAHWRRVNRLLPSRYKTINLGDKIHKGAKVLASKDIADLYKGLVANWEKPELVVKNAKESPTVLTDGLRKSSLTNDIEQMMLLDVLSYLPEGILTKIDRASMAVSLETRVPFLNHEVAEFAWSLPLEYKLRKGVSKWCLREVLYKYVPKELVDRPKMGFGVPIAEWLRGPLQHWAEQLLDAQRLEEEGFFVVEPIREMWQEHLTSVRNWQYPLWDVLMFQAWYEKHHK